MNEGIKYAIDQGPTAILMMNDDTYFEDNYIETIGKISEENPGSKSVHWTSHVKSPRIFFSGVEKMIWWKAKGINYHNGCTIRP